MWNAVTIGTPSCNACAVSAISPMPPGVVAIVAVGHGNPEPSASKPLLRRKLAWGLGLSGALLSLAALGCYGYALHRADVLFLVPLAPPSAEV